MKKSEQMSRQKLLLIGSIIAVVSFVLGMRSDAIFASVAPLFGVRVATGSLDLSSVQETYKELKANYDGDIDDQELIYGANRGLTAALGDPHTSYMDPKEADEFDKSLRGDIGGGIGAEIGLRNNQPTVIRALDNTPAKKSGILAGDTISRVNDESVVGWSADKVVEKIRGDVGTSVRLTVRRDDGEKEFNIIRQSIVSPAVESNIDNGTGILKVHRFNDETGKVARSAAAEFKKNNVNKVILDLRGNPGGTVTAASELAGLWLDDKVIMTERRGASITKTVKSTAGQAILSGIKTVVLIDGGSASASEIVAGAMRDYNIATLVGEKSYGKGSVQVVIDNLKNDAQIKVTEARWFTPNGKTIDKVGIEPDRLVKNNIDDINKGKDAQLEAAKQL